MQYDTPCDYILTQTSLVDGVLTQPGPISYSGSPGPMFTPTDDEGIARRKAYDDEQEAYTAQITTEQAQRAIADALDGPTQAIRLIVQQEVKAALDALSQVAAKAKAGKG